VVIDEREVEGDCLSIGIFPYFLANQPGTNDTMDLSFGIDHFL